MRKIDLRNYQQDFQVAVLDALNKKQKAHASSPTGTGKARMLGAVLEARQQQGKALVIVHLEQLVHQIAESLRNDFKAHVVIEQATNHGLLERDFEVCVASVQTLASRPEVLSNHEFSTVCIDETHRAATNDYAGVLAYLQETSPGHGLFGVTATPFRTEGSLDTVFDTHCFHHDLLWAWEQQWLVRAISTRVVGEEVVDRYVRLYAPGGLRDPDGKGLPTIIAAASIEEGRGIAEEIRGRGVQAFMVDSLEGGDGKTREILAKFQAGEFQCLVGLNQLLTGFDAPRAKALMWSRNTDSPVVYVQGIGRVLRPDPARISKLDWVLFNGPESTPELRAKILENQEAYIDDLVGPDDKTSAYTMGKAVGFSPRFDFEESDVHETTMRGRYVSETYGISPGAFHSKSHIERVVNDRQEFERVAQQSEIPVAAQLTWCETANDFVLIVNHQVVVNAQIIASPDAVVRVDTAAIIRVYKTPLGRWQATIERPERYWMWFDGVDGWITRRYNKWSDIKRPKNTRCGDGPEERRRYVHDDGVPPSLLADAPDKSDAFKQVEVYVYTHFPDVFQLKQKNAFWRNKPLTPGQELTVNSIRKAKIPVPRGLTRGSASHLIDQYKNGIIKAWAPATTNAKLTSVI